MIFLPKLGVFEKIWIGGILVIFTNFISYDQNFKIFIFGLKVTYDKMIHFWCFKFCHNMCDYLVISVFTRGTACIGGCTFPLV